MERLVLTVWTVTLASMATTVIKVTLVRPDPRVPRAAGAVLDVPDPLERMG